MFKKILITFIMFFGLYSISSANSFEKINSQISIIRSASMTLLPIVLFIIIVNQLIKLSFNTKDNSNKNNSNSKTVTEQKPTKIQDIQPIKQQSKPDMYMPDMSRIDNLVKQFESLQNGLKLVHYELDKNQTIQFNLLKEQAYNEFKKIDWMKNHNKDVANSYQIIIDDYENAMMAEYERLKEHLNYVLKNSIEENSNTINLIKNI